MHGLSVFRRLEGNQFESEFLKNWIAHQRRHWLNGCLSKEREKMLSKIGFTFDPWLETWLENYDLLLDYKKKEGHFNVPRFYVALSPAGKKVGLGHWVINLRYQKHKLSHEPKCRSKCANAVKIDKIKMLESVGFEFAPRISNDDRWWRFFNELQAYQEEHGDLVVKQKDNYELCQWMKGQRQKIKNGVMNNDREGFLDSIGFNFESQCLQREETKWRENFAKLETFWVENGHLSFGTSAFMW